MKNILYYALLIPLMAILMGFVFVDKVNAETSEDYFYFTGQVGDTANTTTGYTTQGLQTSNWISEGTSSFLRVNFGYYNLNDTVKMNQKYRIVATFCSEGGTHDNYNYEILGKNGMNIEKFSYSVTNGNCVFLNPSGRKYISNTITLTLDFVPVENSSVGMTSIRFFINSRDTYFWISARNINLYNSSEIVQIETQNQMSQGIIGGINQSKDDIINNQNQNQQQTNDLLNGIISGATQNKNDIINNQNQMSQGIINGATQNKNDIINNQNQNQQQTNDLLNGVISGATQNKNDIINNQNQNQQQTNEKLDNLNQTQQETNNKLDGINDTMNNDDIDSSSASGFFGSYKDNDYGLSSIITAPLKLVQNLNNSKCKELSLSVPFVNQDFDIPCMSIYYKEHFNSAYTLYQSVTTGFIAYWIAVKIYALVKGFKDPENDKIEVMDL